MKILFPLLGLIFLLGCHGSPYRYNVIYISLEDAFPSFGCYGDSTAYTPFMDRFAGEAVLFEDVHCQVALCTPSRTSILTGIRPSTSGIVKIDDDWRVALPHATSLPRHFRDQGYYTSICGKIHDGRNGGMDSAYVRTFDTHGIGSNELAYQSLQDAADQDTPFFLAIGYAQAHDPWTPPAHSTSHYTLDQFPVAEKSHQYQGEEYDDRGVRQLQRNYYAEVTEVDSLIGGLIERISALGLYQNSIIIVGALDHGYNLGWRGRWGKGNCYDNETMVPLLIRIPENSANGRRASGLVELVDIYPTLVDYCKFPPPTQELEGHSLRGLLEQPGRPWKKAAFTHRAYAVEIMGVKTKDYNLIDFAGDSVQLFDRKHDPNNLRDIAPDHPDIVTELLELKAAGWRGALPGPQS